MSGVGWALAAGGLALGLAVFALPALVRVPFALLLLNLGLVWGFVGVLRVSHLLERPFASGWIAAFTPFLLVPFLANRVVRTRGADLPPWLEVTVAGEVLVTAVAVFAGVILVKRVGSGRAWKGLMITGTVLVAALFAIIVRNAEAVSADALVLIALSVTVVAGALVAQAAVARAFGGRAVAFASPAALVAAGAQLMDGVQTYLAVKNPLGLLPSPAFEQVPLSAWVLEHAGVAYPVAKGALALAVTFAVDVRREKPGQRIDAVSRVMLYLLVAYFGLRPALFSALQIAT